MKQQKTGRSKYKDFSNKNNPSSDGRMLAALEKNKDDLMNMILEYRNLLVSKELAENRTELRKKEIGNILSSLNSLASSLDMKNAGEGTSSLIMALLSSNLILSEQINELRFNQYVLYKKIPKGSSDIEDEVDSSSP